MPASGWPLLFYVIRLFPLPPMSITCHSPSSAHLWPVDGDSIVLRNIRCAFARLHTFMTHRTVKWIFIAMKISCIFVLVFQAGQSVGWHFPGAAMNLKVFRTRTTSIIPAGQQFYFLHVLTVLLFISTVPVRSSDVRVPWRLFMLSLFVLVSFLTHAYAGFSLFVDAAFVCLIRRWLLAQLSKFCQSIRFSHFYKLPSIWSVWWRGLFRGWASRAVGQFAELKGAENQLWSFGQRNLIRYSPN